MKISNLLSLALAATATSTVLAVPFPRAPEVAAAGYHAEVMGPLNRIQNWAEFDNHLHQLKANGIFALTTDIWWGWVEAAGDNQFDFSYYRELAKHIRDSGLRWVPIISTHQCGGSGTTECNIGLPQWYLNGLSDDQKYTSIHGTKSVEAPSPWALVNGKTSVQELGELYEAFAKTFADYADIVDRIDLSGGASGELRYPSYSTDNWSYPGRGELQVYNAAAISSFRNSTMAKYNNNMDSLNKAWGSSISDPNAITPPCDTTFSTNVVAICQGKAGSDYFWKGRGWDSGFGRDFFDWYQKEILDWGVQLVQIAQKTILPSLPKAKIAVKIAGVHWQYHARDETKSAALATGYVDYDKLITAMRDNNAAITFTAIEQNDQAEAPFYSGAATLAHEFYGKCQRLGATCFAENALSIHESELYKYKNMRNILKQYNVNGLTLLRYVDLIDAKYNALKLYTSFVSNLDDNSKSIRFEVNGIPASNSESLAILGNIPELGAWTQPLPLARFTCNAQACTWIATLPVNPYTTSVDFKVVKVNDGKIVSYACGNNASTSLSSRVTNVLVNAGAEFSEEGIRTVRVNNIGLC
ncbi:glycosyl hydrolase family 14-domain-containing protein [Phlyctochytrium arcticum]|nr:glycosyl hydrolase family 14-domain-containing protein [Phlyctochytrium arcticum]